MQQGHKFRIYPAPQQASTLLRWIGCQRSIYNAKVAEDRYFRTFAKKSLTDTGEYAPIDQQYAHFKTDTEAQLTQAAVGIDRGVAIKLASSSGSDYDFTTHQKARIKHLQLRKKVYQRRMARQTKSSMRREKTKHHAARIDHKLSDMRHDLAH
jgi:transposase